MSSMCFVGAFRLRRWEDYLKKSEIVTEIISTQPRKDFDVREEEDSPWKFEFGRQSVVG